MHCGYWQANEQYTKHSFLASRVKNLKWNIFIFKYPVLSKICTTHTFLLQRFWKGQTSRFKVQILTCYSVCTRHHGNWSFQKSKWPMVVFASQLKKLLISQESRILDIKKHYKLSKSNLFVLEGKLSIRAIKRL